MSSLSQMNAPNPRLPITCFPSGNLNLVSLTSEYLPSAGGFPQLHYSILWWLGPSLEIQMWGWPMTEKNLRTQLRYFLSKCCNEATIVDNPAPLPAFLE